LSSGVKASRAGSLGRFSELERMMSDHTIAAFDRELAALGQGIAEMGAIASQMASDAMGALSSLDSLLAQSAVESDFRLKALQREVEQQATLESARRQPVAKDLREIIGAMRIAGDLERIGELAKNIAERAMKIGPGTPPIDAALGLRRMNDAATRMLSDVLDAYAKRDAAQAQLVWSRVAELDSLGDLVDRDLLTHMMKKPRAITAGVQLLFCSKNIGRIGEHATNVAETVYYVVTGGAIIAIRPEGGADTGRRRTSAPT
jgi:phosphate transport system protein